MAQPTKSILRRLAKRERESRVVVELTPTSRTPLVNNADYQAPLTARALSAHSKWLIVRNNIHKIRSWGMVRRSSRANEPFHDWYLFFQMRRELKRTKEQIRALQYRRDFAPVHYFELPIDETRVQRFNVSHVRPTDGIYYAGLGAEPIVLQYLLYYFSRECPVPYNSMFYSFLSDVNAVLDTNRKRLNRVVVFRKLALIITISLFIFLLIMLFSMILSVVTTMSILRQMYRNDSFASNAAKPLLSTARLSTTGDNEHYYDHDW